MTLDIQYQGANGEEVGLIFGTVWVLGLILIPALWLFTEQINGNRVHVSMKTSGTTCST
jgi:hypothetical protein